MDQGRKPCAQHNRALLPAPYDLAMTDRNCFKLYCIFCGVFPHIFIMKKFKLPEKVKDQYNKHPYTYYLHSTSRTSAPFVLPISSISVYRERDTHM